MIFEIEVNANTCGWSCYFENNGKKYWADLSYITEDTECMIFECFEDGSVNTSEEAYCNRGMTVSITNLLFCIKEFIMLTNRKI